MASRRFTRLTNGFSKRADYHAAAVGLFVAHFNFCRDHEASRHPCDGAAANRSRLDYQGASNGVPRKRAVPAAQGAPPVHGNSGQQN